MRSHLRTQSAAQSVSQLTSAIVCVCTMYTWRVIKWKNISLNLFGCVPTCAFVAEMDDDGDETLRNIFLANDRRWYWWEWWAVCACPQQIRFILINLAKTAIGRVCYSYLRICQWIIFIAVPAIRTLHAYSSLVCLLLNRVQSAPIGVLRANQKSRLFPHFNNFIRS